MDALLRRRIMMLGGEPPTPPPPPYDSRVEYIETNGNQYIDLGIKGNAATDALYIDFQITTVTTQMRLIAANQQNAPCQIYINGSQKYGYRQGSSWKGVDPGTTVGTTRHTWLCDYFHLVNTLDGVDYTMEGASSGITTPNLLLGGAYTTNPTLKAKIYACKIYRSGNLLLDLIPVRVGTTGCMFDTISQTLYTNAGSGSYSYGNDINI